MQLSADIARKVVEARSRPRSSLADPKLMNLLFQRDAGENRHIVRWGMWAAVLSYMAYGVFDWFLFPDIAARLVIARIAVGVIFLAAIEMGVRRGTALAILHLIAASAIVTGLAFSTPALTLPSALAFHSLQAAPRVFHVVRSPRATILLFARLE